MRASKLAHKLLSTVALVALAAAGIGVGAAPANAAPMHQYSNTDAPVLTKVTPSSGPLAGGTELTLQFLFVPLNSAGDVPDVSITIGGAPCTSVAKQNTWYYSCITPSSATAGAKDVVATSLRNSQASNAVSFTYVLAPSVASPSPNGGPTTGGTSISIGGNNLATTSAVTVGGNPCTNLVITDDHNISCTTPAGLAGPQDVVVRTAGGSATSGKFYYQAPAPTVTSISPTSGSQSGGTNVTITGTNFVSGETTVLFGEYPCTNIFVVSATSITCTTPAHAIGLSDVRVSTVGGLAAGPQFTFGSNAPIITSVSPNSGPRTGGTQIVIKGSNFLVSPLTKVTIGTVSCDNIIRGETQITCTTPANSAGTMDVIVSGSWGTTTSAKAFTYLHVKPTITAISPTAITVLGGPITLTGNDFVGTTSVDFAYGTAKYSCGAINVTSETSMTCQVGKLPAAVATSLITKVTSNEMVSDNGPVLTILTGKPTAITSSPAKNPTTGLNQVTFSGTNFSPGIEVKIGNKLCTNVTVASLTSLSCTAPANTAGAQKVTFKDAINGLYNVAAKVTYAAATKTSIRTAVRGTASPLEIASTLAAYVKTISAKLKASPFVDLTVTGYATTKAIYDANVGPRLNPDSYKDIALQVLAEAGAKAGSYTLVSTWKDWGSSLSLPPALPDAKTVGWVTVSFTYYSFAK